MRDHEGIQSQLKLRRQSARALALSFALALLALTLPLPGQPSVQAGTNNTIASLSLSGSPFAAEFAPLPTSVVAALTLNRSAKVTVRVFTPEGQLVRTLAFRKGTAAGAHTWSWNGLDSAGHAVADGNYELRVRAANGLGTVVATRDLRKGLPQIFPANPGAIVIVVDPGHGGRFLGACNGKLCEKTFNLDISLKLRALLQRAGVTVVMTRTTDAAVNVSPSDVNGDGLTNGYDDLMARNDIANQARGDLNIHNHNNGSRCACDHGTEIWTNYHQPWTSANAGIATDLAREQLIALGQFSDGVYLPFDRGIKDGDYYYMAPYAVTCPTAAGANPTCSPPWLPRPVLMPSVLTEALFMQNPIEFALLKRADVRLALAASYYLGIAEYINSRALGIGYELVSGPAASVSAGSNLSYRLKVTNRGNEPSESWSLQLHSVPRVPVYDGSGQLGTLMGSVSVPDGLQPGASVELDVAASAPPGTGQWLVKSDVRLADNSYASATGVASLQMPLTAVTP